MPSKSLEKVVFKEKLKEMIGSKVLQTELSEGLFEMLSKDFFDKSAEDRCTELVNLSVLEKFYELFVGSDITLYAFLLGAVDENFELMKKFKATRFERLVTAVEIDNYHKEACEFWKQDIEQLLSSLMFYKLSSTFQSLSPADRYKELCDLKSKHASSFSGLKSYTLVLKMVGNDPHLIEALKASPMWKNLASVELDLFHKKTRDLLAGEDCDEAFIANLSKYLKIDYFENNSEKKLDILKNSSDSLITYLKQHKDSADKFLRKSVGESLIKNLEESVFKDCLIPVAQRAFYEEMNRLAPNSFDWEFTNGLQKHLLPNFLKLSAEERFENLKSFSQSSEALDVFRANLVAANIFLRKSLEGPIFTKLECEPELRNFLSAPRRVRNREKHGFYRPVSECKTECEQEPPNKQARTHIPTINPFGSGR